MDDDDTVREDLGYRRDMEKQEIYRRGEPADKIRIEYTRGDMAGQIVRIKTCIAEDLIQRGYAKEIRERDPGEEG